MSKPATGALFSPRKEAKVFSTDPGSHNLTKARELHVHDEKGKCCRSVASECVLRIRGSLYYLTSSKLHATQGEGNTRKCHLVAEAYHSWKSPDFALVPIENGDSTTQAESAAIDFDAFEGKFQQPEAAGRHYTVTEGYIRHNPKHDEKSNDNTWLIGIIQKEQPLTINFDSQVHQGVRYMTFNHIPREAQKKTIISKDEMANMERSQSRLVASTKKNTQSPSDQHLARENRPIGGKIRDSFSCFDSSWPRDNLQHELRGPNAGRIVICCPDKPVERLDLEAHVNLKGLLEQDRGNPWKTVGLIIDVNKSPATNVPSKAVVCSMDLINKKIKEHF